MSAPWRTTWWGSPINSYKMLQMQLEILLKILYCKKIRNNKNLKNQWCGSGFFSSSASLKNWRLLLLPLPCFQITSEKLLMKWNNMGSFFCQNSINVFPKQSSKFNQNNFFCHFIWTSFREKQQETLCCPLPEPMERSILLLYIPIGALLGTNSKREGCILPKHNFDILKCF